jgi:hypothetical protein
MKDFKLELKEHLLTFKQKKEILRNRYIVKIIK